MQQIILHGATNAGSSNFGDFIYGNELYKFCKAYTNKKVCFWDPSDYFKKYISNYDDEKPDISKSDGLIYIPGGYFCEPPNSSLKQSYRRFMRYMPVGLRHILKSKPIYITGLGAGPIDSICVKAPARLIVRKAKMITVRDSKSLSTIKNMGRNDVWDFGDMILSFDLRSQGHLTNQISKISNIVNSGKKILLIHYNHSKEALSLYADGCKEFLKCHDEYFPVVASDSILQNENQLFSDFSSKLGMKCFHFIYDNPYEMLSLLQIVNLVITCKLHVGVVAAMFNKSVISTAVHVEKTKRFYVQIGEADRCIALNDSSDVIITNLLEKYHAKEIAIPQEQIDLAKEHFNKLKEFFNSQY